MMFDSESLLRVFDKTVADGHTDPIPDAGLGTPLSIASGPKL